MGPIWSDGPLWSDALMVTMLFLGHGVVLLGRGFDLDFGLAMVVGCLPESPTVRLLVGLASGGRSCSWVTDTN